MKKFLALIAVCFMLTAMLASCSWFGTEPETPCTEHVDADKNLVCDNCEAELEPETPPECTEHVDADGNYVCDNCDTELERPAPNGFVVKFNTNGAGEIADATVEEGTTVAAPTAPEKVGYTFLGWYNGDVEYDFSAEVVANITLTAKWEAIEYSVVFKADGVQVGETLTYTVENKNITAPAVPAKDGYTGAWEAYELTIGDVEVNAVYSVITYNVVFMADGVQVGDTLTYTVENKAVTAPAVPEKEGYNGAWEAYELTIGNVTVNAVYTIKTYTVTLSVNGVEKTVSVNHGDAVALPELEIPTGYIITDWKNGDASYDLEAAVKSDLALVAVIAFVETDYQFNDDNELITVGKLNISDPSITEDAAAKDGYAVLGTTTFNGSGSGLTIHFDHIDISEYLNIFVRVKTTNGVDIFANGKSVVYGNYSAYTYVDILPALAGETYLDYIQISRNSVAGINIYVDEIIFVDEPYLKDNKVEFTTIPSTSAGYTSTDVDGAVQITGKAWVYDMYNLGDGVNGADIQTLTIRYKITDDSTPVMKFFSGSKMFYIDLRGNQSGDGIISCETDAEGYILLTLNFAAFSRDSGDTWLPAERATLTLTDIGIGCNNATGKPIFDYVAFNVVELPEVNTDYDESYLTQKGDNSYYISDFNNESVMQGVTEIGINPWGSSVAENGTATHGSFTNGHGTVTGLNIKVNESGYTAFLYTLPEAFDLSQAETIVIKIAASGWHNGGANAFALLKSGDTYVNIGTYSTFYNGQDMSGDPAAFGDVININYLSGYAVVDVAAFMEGTGLTTIDGIVFGQNSTSVTHTVDEVYYTVKSEEANGYTINFSTANTIANDYTLTDTDDGALQLSGKAWGTGARYNLDQPIAGSNIATMTFRFKVTGGESAIIYLNGSDTYYWNLSGGLTDFATSNTVDAEGYTVLTIDFTKVSGADSLSLSYIVLKCNNATGAPTFDYIAIEYKA